MMALPPPPPASGMCRVAAGWKLPPPQPPIMLFVIMPLLPRWSSGFTSRSRTLSTPWRMDSCTVRTAGAAAAAAAAPPLCCGGAPLPADATAQSRRRRSSVSSRWPAMNSITSPQRLRSSVCR